MNQATYIGTGHRKNSIARVRVTPGSGKLLINGVDGELYLQFSPNYLQVSRSPLSSLGLENKYDITIKAEGGGLTGQTEAIRLGLTRDSRSKERKKYGLRKARKAPQFSKR
jgi:small subunit ribosomal protein S9